MAQIDPPSVFDDLPGDLMIWVLIVSELLVFGAGLAAFLGVRLTDPAGNRLCLYQAGEYRRYPPWRL